MIRNSLGLAKYLLDNEAQLSKLQELVDKLVDIIECRINFNLRKIAESQLCDLPAENEQWSTETLLERTENRCTSNVEAVNQRNMLIEAAVRDLIAEVSKGVSENQKRELAPCYEAVYYSYNVQGYDMLVHCTRASLDQLKARLSVPNISTSFGKPASRPFFKTDVVLNIPNVVLQPKLEDIQLALNRVTNMILDASKKVKNWRPFTDSEPNSTTKVEDNANVANNKDVNKVILTLSSTINTLKKDVESHREQFIRFDFVWKEDKNETVQKFLASNPTIADFEAEINRFEYIEREINDIPSQTAINVLLISAEPLRLALSTETKAWKQTYGLNLNSKVKKDMEEMMEYMENKTMRLNRKIADIDDLRNAVTTLREIRETEVNIDMKLQPVEEAYQLLTKHSVSVTKEETEMVDSLRYSWKKLKTLVAEVQENLSKIQPVFKAQLIQNVQKFSSDVSDFTSDYNVNGPMVSNIAPKVASERLNVFQRTFDELNRKWETYTAGEELFCLPVTEFPTLAKIKKELKLLQSLYSLYNDVLEKRGVYYETLWTEVIFDKMNTEMNDFQNKIKKLPKSIKDWDAFLELKKIVDDLTAIIPLLEMMSNKALQSRHWDQIMKLTNTKFNLDPDLFYMRHLMDAPLLDSREDIEEISVAAVKEADIEAKLKAVVAEWDEKVFVFAQFKNRGNIVMKPAATAEIIAAMEDSLMTLGSLMSNRYNAPFKATIQQWVHNLSTASEVIENWLSVQNLWIYLEAVFVGGDIAKQMPKEAKRFQNIDKSWLKIMQTANEHPAVIYCCVVDETIASLLPHMTEQLEMCQKSLSGYLESKRAIFPRFYFVSDPALLEILGQASDSHTIQAHLKSVFDNIQMVNFHEKDYDQILAIESSEGEKVALSKSVMASGNVEIWLGTLLKQMQVSINDIIREAASRMNDMPLLKFLDDYPAQIGLLGIQMQWTAMSEEALLLSKSDKKKMAQTLQKVTDILNQLIDQVSIH
jgi:dynein heavy chain